MYITNFMLLGIKDHRWHNNSKTLTCMYIFADRLKSQSFLFLSFDLFFFFKKEKKIRYTSVRFGLNGLISSFKFEILLYFQSRCRVWTNGIQLLKRCPERYYSI